MVQTPGEEAANPADDPTYQHFVRLIVHSEPAIRRFIRSLMPSEVGVDDLVQETALESWQKFSHFLSTRTEEKEEEEFLRWALTIARFKVMSWQRNRNRDRMVFREEVIEALAETAAASEPEWKEELAAVESCLQSLPPAQRRLLLAVHRSGDSVSRIATETGTPQRKLYAQLYALRRILLDCVQSRLRGPLAHE
ncbi:MAG: DNA-directed RNA polymerase sigma-70 factor [Pirellulaceae bacterium]|nr:MAG: DNA-directed RNA polymerase sigma-70 factor [Pirellulaceae bacterium]